MSTGDPERAAERVWRAAESDPRAALESGLPPTDLHTLLLAVAARRAESVTAGRLAQRWREDRFVRPASVDPRILAIVSGRLWASLPEQFIGVQLSPVAPLGTCSAVGPVDQNRVVSTMRGTEVVSDPTNVLALEAAARRRAQMPGQRVDLASCHRALRAQVFEAPYSAHFELFVLVSSARDVGAARTQATLLADHLTVWSASLTELLPRHLVRMRVTGWTDPMRQQIRDVVLPTVAADLAGVEVVEDDGRRRAQGYYSDASIAIHAVSDGAEVELGDGGITTWTAQLTANDKERCMISCVATERLAGLASV